MSENIFNPKQVKLSSDLPTLLGAFKNLMQDAAVAIDPIVEKFTGDLSAVKEGQRVVSIVETGVDGVRVVLIAARAFRGQCKTYADGFIQTDNGDGRVDIYKIEPTIKSARIDDFIPIPL